MKIAFCGENTIPHLDFSKIAMIFSITYGCRSFLVENKIPYIHTVDPESYFYDERDYVIENYENIKHFIEAHASTDMYFLFHCQMGRERSRKLALMFAKYFENNGHDVTVDNLLINKSVQINITDQTKYTKKHNNIDKFADFVHHHMIS